jgi:hypothetical protein
MDAMTDFKAIEVSVKNNGFDFWMSYKNEEAPFQNAARLEVSGILKESESNRVGYRSTKKKKRLDRYPNPLPVIVAIIEFGTPVSRLETP